MPVGLYRLSTSRPPSTVHSARCSLLRSHHRQLSGKDTPCVLLCIYGFVPLNLTQVYAARDHLSSGKIIFSRCHKSAALQSKNFNHLNHRRCFISAHHWHFAPAHADGQWAFPTKRTFLRSDLCELPGCGLSEVAAFRRNPETKKHPKSRFSMLFVSLRVPNPAAAYTPAVNRPYSSPISMWSYSPPLRSVDAVISNPASFWKIITKSEPPKRK